MAKDLSANIPLQHRDYFEALETRVSQAHWDFVEYRTLFYEGANVDLLNATAPHFFSVVQRALTVSIFTCIRALTDQHATRSHENVSLRGFAKRLEQSQHPLARAFSASVEDYVARAEPVCRAVSKKIAHFDADHVVGVNRKTSLAVGGDDIEALIRDAGGLLDSVTGIRTIRVSNTQPGGAAEVLRRLGA